MSEYYRPLLCQLYRPLSLESTMSMNLRIVPVVQCFVATKPWQEGDLIEQDRQNRGELAPWSVEPPPNKEV
jgi:hypothetical protein